MTSFRRNRETVRDDQDRIERGVWGSVEDVDGGGRIIKVRGTDTVDEEVLVLNTGFGFNLDDNSDAEVFMLSAGNDTNNKFGLTSIPWQKQRKWKKNTGGVQNPTDPDKSLEFNSKRAHVTDPNFAVGGGVIEVKDGTIYIRGNMVVEGNLSVGGSLDVAGVIVTPLVVQGSPTVVVPGFEE